MSALHSVKENIEVRWLGHEKGDPSNTDVPQRPHHYIYGCKLIKSLLGTNTQALPQQVTIATCGPYNSWHLLSIQNKSI